MVNLVIDIGNTFSKIALFDNRKLQEFATTIDVTEQTISAWFQKYEIHNAIVSSVRKSAVELETYLSARSRFFRFDASVQAGIVNHYKTPLTLGLDRYAAVIGARAVMPRTNCLIIDAGTCVTYDFIDSESNYYGGSISPGIGMRLKAMHTFTGRLPLVEFNDAFDSEYGQDTKSALVSGVSNGIIFEVTGFINSFYNKHSNLKVLLCGGDMNFFDRRLKNSIFAGIVKTEPYLVLIGLNEVIHQHNE